MSGQAGQRRQVKLTGAGLAAATRAGLPFGLKVGRGDADGFVAMAAGGAFQGDALSLECIALGQKAHAQASGHPLQIQRRQVPGQPEAGVIQQQIGGEFMQFAIAQTGPGAQGTASMRQAERIVDPLPPGSEVDVIQFGKQRS